MSHSRPRGCIKVPLHDRVALALLLFFLLTDVLGGAVRYFAVWFHLAWLPYMPHLLLAISVVPLFLVYVLSEGVTSTYLVVFVLLGVGAGYGVLNLTSARQVEFGLWVLVSFLYGIVVLPAIVRGWRKLVPYVLVLWALGVVGIFINVFHQWPWAGFEYQVGSTVIQATRLWKTAGSSVVRLAGFGRSSSDTADQILFSALFLRLLLPQRRWWMPIWLLSGVAIALTTSKAQLAAYLLLSVMWFFYHGAIRSSWRLIPICAAFVDILLPFSMTYIKVDWLSSVRRSAMSMMLAGSFVERLQITWPRWIEVSVAHGSALLGRGLGGVGSATAYFQPALLNAGDNVAVYLYGAFGILGLMVLILYGWKASRIRGVGDVSPFFFLCTCVVLVQGLTSGIMEGPITAIVFGMSLRYALQSPMHVTQHVGPRVRPAERTGQARRFRTAEM